MRNSCRFLTILSLSFLSITASGEDEFEAPLPSGVHAVWDLKQAQKESTPTRERVCLNGLWRWQPARELRDEIPSGGWGYFKVPGAWPGITDYEQKDCQRVYPHRNWKDWKLGDVTTAWYQREFTMPPEWEGRLLVLRLEYLNSFAAVWVDGAKAGEVRFPGGDTEITRFCHPGRKQVLTLAVLAMPLKGVMLSYSDTFGARKIQGAVARRGLCGDVYLSATPAQARINNLRISTSVRKWEISLETGLDALEPNSRYMLRAQITEHGHTIKEAKSQLFSQSDLAAGCFTFTNSWKPPKLWDTVSPQSLYEVSISLVDSNGHVLDTALPEKFGFREFWIQGRDFYLNGSRIFLCAVPLDNAQLGAAWATYGGTRESLQRLKSFGINFVYTHNYGCEPGTHLSFAEILRAADDEGVLVSFSQPHFGQYEWKTAEADQTNGYARHAEFYVRAAQNHPSVVCYSMSHNATGTEEEMNPDLIDGIHDERNRWSANNARLALRAEAIVQKLDPSRIIYHHSSGNLGSMHTANFYANFAPIQELSDWFEHWATAGVKPLFLCEYGAPISWDWMMYRGWFQGERTFGSAKVPWELCMAEWNAQFLGDAAYQLTDLEQDCLRWEARQFRDNKLWHRWDYPRNAIDSSGFEQRNAIFNMYLTDNIRSFRTWGVSAFCPWDHGIYWKLRDGANRSLKELKVDWDSLQRPGFSPDYVGEQMEWMNASFERSDWIPTQAARALYRNNMALLAYLAGKPTAFTSKDHDFYPGETVAKQLIVINNSRQPVSADCSWSLALPKPISGAQHIRVYTGQQTRIPLNFSLPAQTKPGRYDLTATVKFRDGQLQSDTFSIDVLPHSLRAQSSARVALFDPKGETARLLQNIGINPKLVNASADLSSFDLLLVGKGALTADSPGPDVTRVRDGLKVLVFEQTSDVLERRFGFRTAEYGLRWVFKRVPDHPLLGGLSEEHLRNWRGAATLVPPKLNYEIGSRHAPEVKWCGIPVTRLWRAGNRGNVASVLIEKPARGDFLPVLDGGFGLQFSPLMEYREGAGLVLFCQMDVNGRTESDPAAEILVQNLLNYALNWKPAPHRQIVYAGDAPGQRHLEQAGFHMRPYQQGKLSTNDILVVSSGETNELPSDSAAVAEFAKVGGHILAIGLDEPQANACLPLKVQMQKAEYISTYFPPFDQASLFSGVSPADVLNHDPRPLSLVTSGPRALGNGVLAQAPNASLVFCQIAPWWFASNEKDNVRRTYRRTSFLLTRLLSNMGAAASTPLLERFASPARPTETRYLEGLYLDKPQEWDHPYRFFCW